jgi:hypothetical protein
MTQVHTNDAISNHQQPHDVVKLIRKLRWIGMEEEARCLEVAVRSLPEEMGANQFAAD